MIVDSPLTFGLTVGSDRRIPQEDDSRVLVPAIVAPVALMAQTHTSTALASTVPMEQSLIFETIFIRVNQPGLVTNLFTLSEGLWELELNMASSFNFVGVNGIDFNSIRMTYKGVTTSLVKRFASTGSHQDYNRVRVLLDQTALISVFVSDTDTIATNEAAGAYIINAIKVI